MRTTDKPVLAALLCAAVAAVASAGITAARAPAQASDTAPPVAQAVANGVWLIPGGIRPKRQPDGNTVIFDAAPGLVVMDTGRHLWHRQAILDFAHARNQDVVGIINSHWHLDHVSGNPDLRRAYPGARVYASRAIDDALTGFLAKSAVDGREYLASGNPPPETAEDVRNDLATIEHGAALRPDVPIDASTTVTFGSRTLRLNLAPHSATAGDVWVYDKASGVAAVGDLVTLPAAFLDTACPDGWRAALDQIWSTPFTLAIPGHGSPMTRDQFARYRGAFNGLVACARSDRTKTACAAEWVENVKPLLGPDPIEQKRAQGMTEYYVGDVLRASSQSIACAKFSRVGSSSSSTSLRKNAGVPGIPLSSPPSFTSSTIPA
jgi:glyoxylase-like metal-dependent hydrolase (beta-lactamase superfamily II)